MFSKRTEVIIIDDDEDDDEDEKEEDNSCPIIIIDDDFISDNSIMDMNNKSKNIGVVNSEGELIFNASVRKQLMSLVAQGYNINEAKEILGLQQEFKARNESIPNAPKWPNGGVAPNFNIFSMSPEIRNFQNDPDKFHAFDENENSYSFFKNHIEDAPLNPLSQRNRTSSSNSDLRLQLQPNNCMARGSKRKSISYFEGSSAKRFKTSQQGVNNENPMRRRRRRHRQRRRRRQCRRKPQLQRNFLVQKHSNNMYNNLIGIEIGIMPANLSENMLTTDQFKDLRTAILDKIVMRENNVIKPTFFRSYITTDELVITCTNEDTVDWLRMTVNEIKQWDGVDLQMENRNKIPRRYYLTGLFPDSHGMSSQDILHFIDAQNYGLDIAKWEILIQIDKEERVTYVKFSVDDKNLQIVRGNDWKIYYKLKRVYLTLVQSRRQKI